MGGAAILIILSSLLFFIYFLPSIIAYRKKQPNFSSILALNILLGWLLIPWVIALVWALKVPAILVSISGVDLHPCPFCAEQIKRAAIRCRHCQADIPGAHTSSAA